MVGVFKSVAMIFSYPYFSFWTLGHISSSKSRPHFFKFIFFIEKLRQLTHVVGTLSHKGIARRALPASGGKDVDGGE